MKELLKNVLKRTPFFWLVYSLHYRIFHYFLMPRWERLGRPIPPPYPFKQAMLRECAKKYGLKIFVETGTCHGDTVSALLHDFEKIYSIELCEEYYRLVVKRFKRMPKVTLILGDSAIQMPTVLRQIKTINRPVLFWLDGHYSGADSAKGEVATPIFQELAHILSESQTWNSVIAIDDAREFGTNPDYPSLEALTAFVRSKRSDIKVMTNMDVIWILPLTSLDQTS